MNKRDVAVAYTDDKGRPTLHHSEIEQTELDVIIKILEGATFDGLAIEYNGPED